MEGSFLEEYSRTLDLSVSNLDDSDDGLTESS